MVNLAGFWLSLRETVVKFERSAWLSSGEIMVKPEGNNG